MNREAAIVGFLARHGYGDAVVAPLAQDADLRRYLRLTGGPRPAVLMDAPPPADVRPFLRIAAYLAAIGLSVPEIFAADVAEGFVLEEDFGDALFPVMMGEVAPAAPVATATGVDMNAAQTTTLFDAAIDVLVVMHRAAPPGGLPHWDASAMRDTALGTLLDWWWPAMHGTPAPDAARADFTAAFNELLAPVAAGPHGLTHRDYFAGNLLWLPQREGVRQVGVIDFQGASIGHPAYDLVSLLQDARRAIPIAIAERGVARYLAARPELDATAFRAAYVACSAQRHLRVAAQWVRLALRDNRPAYLAYGPHTWGLLNNALRDPAAAPLAAAMERWIPPGHRANPPNLTA